MFAIIVIGLISLLVSAAAIAILAALLGLLLTAAAAGITMAITSAVAIIMWVRSW